MAIRYSPRDCRLALDDAVRATGEPPAQIARRAGVHPLTLYALIKGHRRPRAVTAARLCRVLNVAPETVFPDLCSPTVGEGAR